MIILAACLVTAITAPGPKLSYSYMLWDWTRTAGNYDAFTERVDQCREAGMDTIDLTVAWKQIEPERGRFDFSEIDRRVEYIAKAGLKTRLRLNVSYAHGWPDWFPAALMTGAGGATPTDVLSPFSPGAADAWARAAEALSAHLGDRVDCYMPGFGMHMEVKYGDWISYERPAVSSFRSWLKTRYRTAVALNKACGSGFSGFEAVQPPAVPADLSEAPQSVIDFIQFREDQLAYVTDRFIQGFRKGYPKAKVAVQMGESFRKESAMMSNLAYYRYARLADEVVHSYDFFVHPPDAPHNAFESVRTFAGITGKPVIVEFDGPVLQSSFGYNDDHLAALARECIRAGASGIHVSNYSDSDPRPLGFIRAIAEMTRKAPAKQPTAESLFYVSKWTFYCMSKDETAHQRVYAYYRKLLAAGEKMRIITDENLTEPGLGRGGKLFVSWSPIVSREAFQQLKELMREMPTETDGEPGLRVVDARTRAAARR